MAKADKVSSLVKGSDFQYLQMQAYIRYDEGTLHIQGKGPETNRAYGVSADISLTHLAPNLVKWLGDIPRYYSSMANTDKKYFILQMRYAKSVDMLNFQIKYEPTYNTPYGGHFSISASIYSGLKFFWDIAMSPEKAEETEGTEEMAVEIED